VGGRLLLLIAGIGYESFRMCGCVGLCVCVCVCVGSLSQSLVKHMFSFVKQSLIIDNALPVWGLNSLIMREYMYVCVCVRCVIARLLKHFSK